MIKLLTSTEMREVDRATIEDYGLPGAVLMEHAGLATARAAREMVERPGAHICVLCGRGNNGGDGFVAARWLRRWGFVPEVFLFGDPAELEGDARLNFSLWRRAGYEAESITSSGDLVVLVGSLRRCELVIDALLGTGVSGPPREPLAAAIRQVRQAGRPVLAVDLPSGVNADTGEAYDPHIVATRTVTFGAWKRGLALYPGAAAAGRVELVDIGIPDPVLDSVEDAPALLERQDVARWLPPRRPDTHKGQAGRVLIVGGSAGMGGAVILAGRAAARGGAGLVTLAVPECLAVACETATLEVMSRPLPQTNDGLLAGDALRDADDLLEAADAVAVGPGLRTSRDGAALLAELMAAVRAPLVIDADGLNLLARQPDLAGTRPGPTVLTPHPGEAGRLLGREATEVQQDRIGTARELAGRFRATAVLKGAMTVIASPEGQVWVNPTGNAAMASGGMGDALTGLLTALLAQGLEPHRAAGAAAWLHGRAADLAAGGSDAGLLATDVIDHLPAARAELRK